MRLTIIAGAVLLVLGMDNASAQCAIATELSGVALGTLLPGNYACQGAFPNSEWNELHTGSTTAGTITDYKLGPTSTTDPTKVVGNYAISGGNKSGTVTYTYTGGGGTYTYNVQQISGTSYYFCQTSPGKNVYTVSVQASHC